LILNHVKSFVFTKITLPYSSKRSRRGGKRRGEKNVCVYTHLLTGHSHTLLQDNFLFATANCHSKENRNGSVCGCCRTMTACGVSGSQWHCDLAVTGDFVPSIVRDQSPALSRLEVSRQRNKAVVTSPSQPVCLKQCAPVRLLKMEKF
jgi:hypothetical protein